MKRIRIIPLFAFFPFFSMAQQSLPDSLRGALETATNDSIRFEISRLLYTYYEEAQRDSALSYTNMRANIAGRNNRTIEKAYVMGQKAYQLIYLGRFGEALECLLQAYPVASDPKNDVKNTWALTPYPSPDNSRLLTLSMLNHIFGHLMLQTQNTEQQLRYLKEGRRIGLEINNAFRIVVADMVLGSSYVSLHQPDSAMFFAKEGERFATMGGIQKYYSYIWFVMGDVYLQKGDKAKALVYYRKALQSALEQNNLNSVAVSYDRLINYYRQEGNKDSALLYALKNLALIKSLGAVTSTAAYDINIGTAYEQLYKAYNMENSFDSAFKYQGLALAAKDSLNKIRIKNLTSFQNLNLNEQLRLQNIEKEKIETESKIRTYTLLGGIILAVIIMLLIYRNNRQKQKAYNLLQQQKAETDVQRDKVNTALQDLKATQSQLIQSEKMASLGELTAGIAHEIQNPLNFVNNFSELSIELIDELKIERQKTGNEGNKESEDEILDDIAGNLHKINHHGKRADIIVKSMLQHSRLTKGAKEPTDINALCDEYLRLSCHGLRAKDKSFNAVLMEMGIKTDFDESIGKINIVPQDMGRVLLNLFNNAFYAVNEKQKVKGEGYKAQVSVQTKKLNDKVEIIVTDNGSGIPANVVDKIFQPFFTTKPTGQGTGLGLSLTYDMITKVHHGTIKVQTKENEGTEFKIILPY